MLNERRHFNEIDENYSLPGARDTALVAARGGKPGHAPIFGLLLPFGPPFELSYERSKMSSSSPYAWHNEASFSGGWIRSWFRRSTAVMIGIQSLSPCSEKFLDLTTLQYITSLAAKYNTPAEDLVPWSIPRLLNKKSQEDINVLCHQCSNWQSVEPYKDAFYALFKLITYYIAFVLPVSTAWSSCKTSSFLHQILTYLRNSTADKLLSNLAVLSVETKRAKTLDLDAVADGFHSRHKNLSIILHWQL